MPSCPGNAGFSSNSAEPVRLRKGDCILLPTERSFRVASDLKLAPVDVKSLLSLPLNGRIAKCNGGGDCFIVGGHFTLSGDHAGILLGMLPAIVHLRTEPDRAELRWSLERMSRELQAQRPGGLLVSQHLAHMMLVQAVRLHLESRVEGGVGWLFALADKQLSAAMQAMHGDPARHWTLQMLAERGGISRTVFCVEIQRDCRFIGYGVSFSLAYAAGRRQIDKFKHLNLHHRVSAWL
jgi:hypothetical protein